MFLAIKYYQIKLLVANAHRLPPRVQFKKPDDSESTPRPPPIIVKCVTMNDRNAVLSAAKALQSGTDLGVYNDLPTRLKEIRNNLLSKAYEIRKKDQNMKTRIRESPSMNAVWLEFKSKDASASTSQGWTKFES